LLAGSKQDAIKATRSGY